MDEISDIVNSYQREIWIRCQLIVLCEDEDGNTVKTYQIFIGSDMELVELFLIKNADIIEAEGITPKLKFIFKSSENNFGSGM